jgi:hypothetical protein
MTIDSNYPPIWANRVLGNQKLFTAHEAHMARQTEAGEQYQNANAVADNWGHSILPNNYTEENKYMRDAMNAMPLGTPLAANPHIQQGAMSGQQNAMPMGTAPSALNKQVDGGHYKGLKIQPIEYIHANNIPFAEGCAIKYLTRWRSKGGIPDLEKAKHFIELLIELESRK